MSFTPQVEEYELKLEAVVATWDGPAFQFDRVDRPWSSPGKATDMTRTSHCHDADRSETLPPCMPHPTRAGVANVTRHWHVCDILRHSSLLAAVCRLVDLLQGSTQLQGRCNAEGLPWWGQAAAQSRAALYSPDLVYIFRRHLKVHSYYGGQSRLHQNIMCVRATRQHGDWLGRPTESGLGLWKGHTRFNTKNGLSTRSEIEEGAGSLPAEGGIAREDAGM